MLIQWYILFFSLHLFAFKVIFSQGILLGWNANHHKNNLHHLFYHRKNFQITKIKNHEVFYNEKKQWFFLFFLYSCLQSKLHFPREYCRCAILITVEIIYNNYSILEKIFKTSQSKTMEQNLPQASPFIIFRNGIIPGPSLPTVSKKTRLQ